MEAATQNQQHNKMFESFLLCGIKSYNYPKETFITSLELVCGPIKQKEFQKTNEFGILTKYVDISNGDNELWMKIHYNEQKSPICDIDIYECIYENDILKIEKSLGINPLPKRKYLKSSPYQYIGNIDEHNLYKGDFDLSKYMNMNLFLGEGKIYILGYKRINNESTTLPMTDIISVEIEKINVNFRTELRVHLPNGFPFSCKKEFHFEKKSCLIGFRRADSIFNVRQDPELLAEYPFEGKRNIEHVQAAPLFCFPRHCYMSPKAVSPSKHSFVLTKEDGSRSYAYTLVYYEICGKELEENLKKEMRVLQSTKIYVPKALCLISTANFTDQNFTLLIEIFRFLNRSKNNCIPIERLIANIIDEIPIPEPGNFSVEYEINKSSIQFKQKENIEKFSNENMIILMMLCQPQNLLKLIVALLIERKIVITSVCPNCISAVADALTRLIFPYDWNHVFIPILPEKYGDYTEAIVPFLLGKVKQGKIDNIAATNPEVIYVDLDTGEIAWGEFQTMPKLPKGASEFIHSTLKKLQPIWDLLATEKEFINFDETAVNVITFDESTRDKKIAAAFDLVHGFLTFNALLLKNYSKFLLTPQNENVDIYYDLKELFNINGFLEKRKATTQRFLLHHLVNTSIFASFIQNRTFFSAASSYIIYFDQIIKTKTGALKVNNSFELLESNNTNVFKCKGPNLEGVPSDQFFCYTNFSCFEKCMFIEPREQMVGQPSKLRMFSVKRDTEKINLKKLTNKEWLKTVIQHYISVWFFILHIKLKTQKFFQSCEGLVELVFALIKYMENQNMQISQIVYQASLELCGYFNKKEEAKKLILKISSKSSLEMSTFVHAIFLQARALRKKY